MTYEEARKEILDRFGDTDDELEAIAAVSDWLDSVKNAVERATELESKLENTEKEWREKYRARFGEPNTNSGDDEHKIAEESDEDVTIDEVLEKMRKENE